MVRRGSTVRVRQRALQAPHVGAFLVQADLLFVARAVGMVPHATSTLLRATEEVSERFPILGEADGQQQHD